MSIPIAQLVYAGVWSVSGYYPQFQYVLSPIDSNCYVNVEIQPSVGGPDPSVQPSSVWVLMNVSTGSGITSINGLTDPAMILASSDSTVGITPVAPDTIDFSVPYAPTFPPTHCAYSSSQTQGIVANTILPLVYNTEDCAPSLVGVSLPDSNIVPTNSGLYKVLASVQLNRTNTGNSTVVLFPRVNGTEVANSATYLKINQQEEDIMTVEWFITLVAADALSICVYSTDSDNECLAVVRDPPNGIPAVPSIITTILRIA